jgi:hypothetical protein
MKGFSLTQPWASLVALGHKRIETRSWSTNYRGEVLIHAAKKFPRDCQEMCAEEPFLGLLKAAGYTNTKQLPLGLIVAVARIENVFSTNVINAARRIPTELYQLPHERECGDYSDDRYGWLLTNVRRLSTPLPAAHLDRDGVIKEGGALGLWSVPQVLLDLIAGQGVL